MFSPRPFLRDTRLLSWMRFSIAFALPLAGIFAPTFAREWTRIASPTTNDLTGVHFSDASHGFASGAFGTLLKTADGGLTWTSVSTPVNFSFVSVWSPAQDAVFAGRVGLYGTEDCGITWDSDIGGYEQFSGSIFSILFTAADNGFFLKEGNIFRSTDGGTQWTLVGGSGQFLDDFHFAGGQSIYATGGITFSDFGGSTSLGELERSRDGGLSWQPVTLPGIHEIHAAVWSSERDGLVFTFTNMAHRTTDGGDSWTTITTEMTDQGGNPLPSIITDAIIETDGRIVAVDFAGNFLESNDGIVWTITRGLEEPLTALTALADGTLIAVGNSGNIWRSLLRPEYASPVIESIVVEAREEGDVVVIHAIGIQGLKYDLESSHDLTTWKEDASLIAKQSRLTFTVPRPPQGALFYRVSDSS